MASSLTTRLAALFGAACAALSLAVTAAAPVYADEEVEPEVNAAACTTTPTNGTEERGPDGRRYLVKVPAGLSGNAPLVVALHGGYSNPRQHLDQSGWEDFANDKKFILVAPRGNKDEGDSNPSTWAWHATSTDVDYIKSVVNEVRTKWCVNPKRIHLTGHSNGGQMASRAGCLASTYFASGAVYAPAPPPTGCNPARAISWGVFHQRGDGTVWHEMAYSHVMYWMWENRPCNNDTPDGGTNTFESKRWSCDAGTSVVWRTYHGGNHDWPTGARRTEVMNRMWALFQGSPLP
ncbi:PHB depolymerase family esterase [Nocardia sp. XZ_19_385]|uniref:alpha/beta hydrolase family esterase n=1 Tax=Nocardia sp. XZ_19_385 TaxID=2769488 RepID=UPI0018907ADB|nr:alpha/beta fold hydrolase [Nocardia sp. XZ_19_385]